MLEVKNLNKYYNKKKSNQIHVINNTTFKLGSTGLVSILGHSGSGKTTLLNSLCGIDKVDSGEIIIDGITISKYNANQMDDLRNKYFGYIFQNYNLNTNLSVFENVAFSLKLLGLTDPKEIEERTMRALKIVRMDKYKNRLSKNLSGGQMQRVSIARAIVKDAKIILADEATGNLDRKNTVIIMSILREIANERLVVMVTHEKELAYAYSDRILEIQDGVVIKDIENEAMSQEYSYDDENIIHLGDYQKDELVSDSNTSVNRYYTTDKGNIKIDFIVKDNQVFIQTSSPMEVRIIDENSLVKFDYHKKEDFKTPLIDKSEVKIDPIDESKVKAKYRVNFFKVVIDSIIKLFSGRSIKRFVLMAFMISAFLLTVSFGLLRGFGSIDERKFMTTNKDLVKVEINNVTRKTYEDIYDEISSRDDVYSIVYSVRDVEITTPKYDGDDDTYERRIPLSVLIQNADDYNIEQSLIDKLDEDSVIIDKYVIDILFKSSGRYFQTEKMILQQKIIVNGKEYKIAGVTNQESLNIYVKKSVSERMNLENAEIRLAEYLDRNHYEILIGYTYDGLNPGEIILDRDTYDLHRRQGKKTIDYYGVTFKIKQGVYIIAKNLGANKAMLAEDARRLERYRLFDIINDNDKSFGSAAMYVYTKDYQAFMDDYEGTIVSVSSHYHNAKVQYESFYLGISTTIAVISGIVFIAPLIMLYFLMRSSTISKIREIAINRSLGMRNSAAIAMQFYELVSIISLYAIPGYILAIVFMLVTNGIFAEYALDAITLGGSLLLIFAIIIVVGLLPIIRIVEKVPQKMITKYDI